MFEHTVGEIVYSKYVFCFTIVITLLLTLLHDCTKGALADSTSECSPNYYKDGNDCKECSAGYYGENCSEVCPAPLYGLRCAQLCDCLSCHHIYGCFSNFPIDETTSDDDKTQDKIENKTHASGNILISSDRIIVIFIGSVFCYILIFVIIREMCLKCYRFPQPIGIRTADDVYADNAEI